MHFPRSLPGRTVVQVLRMSYTCSAYIEDTYGERIRDCKQLTQTFRKVIAPQLNADSDGFVKSPLKVVLS